MKTLNEIYNHVIKTQRTDKGRGFKNHLELYGDLFSSYRENASKVFEIGVNRGGSISMWHEYFSNATIYGLDINPEAMERVKGERTVGILLDQSDKAQLGIFGLKHGPFDIGIDDGSHVWSHQILTFETLFPYIKPGGLFVCEDVLTSYPFWLQNSKSAKRIRYATGNISTIDYFKELVDKINFYGKEPSGENTILHEIDWISFRYNSVFIRKCK